MNLGHPPDNATVLTGGIDLQEVAAGVLEFQATPTLDRMLTFYGRTFEGNNMQTRIEWKGGSTLSGRIGERSYSAMDGPPEAGGKNSGPRPMEMVLMGTGGCAAFDVVIILKKGRQDISDCVVEIERNGPSGTQGVPPHSLPFYLTGKKLNHRQVERAIILSAEKYCSASIMLAKTAELTHDFEIVEE